jgi:hypothetical protein
MTINLTQEELHRQLSYLGTCWARSLAGRYTEVVRNLGLQTFRLYRQTPSGSRIFLTTIRAADESYINLDAYRAKLATGQTLFLRRAA